MNAGRPRRVIIWLDPAAPQEPALQVLEGLGAAAELLGLFVEDANLLDLSGHSVAREFSEHGAVSTLDAPELERQFQAHARRLRSLFERMAAQLAMPGSFRVTRGDPREELIRHSADCDTLVLSHSRRSLGPRLAVRPRLDDLLGAGPPTLVFVQDAWRTGDRVVAVFDASPASEAALRIAGRIVAAEGLELSVWLPVGEDTDTEALQRRASELLGRGTAHAFSSVDIDDTAALARAAAAEHARVLVLPETAVSDIRRRIADFLDTANCSLIVVRRGRTIE